MQVIPYGSVEVWRYGGKGRLFHTSTLPYLQPESKAPRRSCRSARGFKAWEKANLASLPSLRRTDTQLRATFIAWDIRARIREDSRSVRAASPMREPGAPNPGC